MSTQKLLVKNILLQALSYKWSLQGLGMLRLYLSDEVRLHVWNKALAFPNASPIHTHPWDFKSTVIAGALQNVRYLEQPEQTSHTKEYHRATLKCGVGGHLMPEQPANVHLAKLTPEYIVAGLDYTERAEEIHESIPADGTVTIVERTFKKKDRDHAYVYWPYGTQWGTAEPRDATPSEIKLATQFSLTNFF